MGSKITILSILNDQTTIGQIIALNSNLNLTGIEYDLFILNNGCCEEIAKEFKTATYYTESKFELSNSESINILLKETETQFICILPNNVYCSENWLYDLLYFSTYIEKSGLAAICSTLTKGYNTSFLSHDKNLVNVLVNDYNRVSGIVLFSQSIVGQLGAFNTNLHGGYEIQEYADRAGKLGHYNYFIPEQNAIQVELNPYQLFKTDPEDFIKELKLGVVFRQLYERTPNQVKAWDSIDKLLVDKLTDRQAVKESNQSTSNFGVVSKLFTTDDTNLINQFAQTYNLTYTYICANSDSINKIKVVFFNQ